MKLPRVLRGIQMSAFYELLEFGGFQVIEFRIKDCLTVLCVTKREKERER